MFTAALFTTARRQTHRCLSVGDWTNKMWCIEVMEYHPAVKTDEAPIHTTTWMTLKTHHVKEVRHGRILYVCVYEISIDPGSQSVTARAWAGGESGGLPSGWVKTVWN